MPQAILVLFLHLLLIGSVSAADSVTLKYAWKPGIYAKVEGYQTQHKYLGEQVQGGMQVDMSYIMGTNAHQAGLQVDYFDIEAVLRSDDPSIQGWMKKYMEAVSGAMPSYIINQQGEMSGATKVPELRDAMLRNLSELLKDAPEAQQQQLAAALAQTFTEEILNQQLVNEWGLLVGQWAGAELEDDGTYEAEFESPIAALGNQLVKTSAQFEFSERVNCDRIDKSRGCVRLLYHSETDDVSVAELLRNMVPAGQPVPDLNVSVVLDLELVTDPDTLLPYYTRQTKRSTAPMETPEGATTVTQVQTSEFRYLYVMGNDQ